MSEIRPLEDDEFHTFVEIFANAYPAMLPENFGKEQKLGLVERWSKAQKEPEANVYYGCFREGKLVGGMRLFDYMMNIHGSMVPVGGVGSICVDLARKKEHIAKDMVEYYLRHYLEMGTYMAALYPFRPDFYRKMGWGYGVKVNQYNFNPGDLPLGSKENVSYLDISDAESACECFNRYVAHTHGMILKKPNYFERILQRGRVIGVKKDGKVSGFLSFSFKKKYKDHFLLHDIEIRDLFYDDAHALSRLLTFLQTQFDQVNRIIYNTHDPDFHWLIHDPRNGVPNIFITSQESNVQGLGIMYRILDTQGLFMQLGEHDFNSVTLKLKLDIRDTFLPENNQSNVVHFENGKATLTKGKYDVEISMDVSEFSSLLMGVVEFRKLIEYGIAKISNSEYIKQINTAFRSRKPVTIEQF